MTKSVNPLIQNKVFCFQDATDKDGLFVQLGVENLDFAALNLDLKITTCKPWIARDSETEIKNKKIRFCFFSTAEVGRQRLVKKMINVRKDDAYEL